MITDLKPYSEYRSSSQVWFGDVPTHWNVLANRGVFFEVKERGHSDASMLSVTIKRGIIHQADLLSETYKKDSSNIDKSKYKLVRPNDLAYNKMRAWQGALGVSSLRGIISPAYVVMRPHVECQPKYFHYLYRTPGFAKEAERWSYGITSDMWSLRPEHFRMIYTLLPPPDEQALIVRFLDWASVRLGKAIAAKRKVIGLLEEQRKAVIQTAVDEVSGADCETIPIRALLRPVKRLGFPKQELLSLFRDYGVIPKDSRENKNADVRDLALCQLVNSGDVVMNKMKAWQGSIAVSNLEGIVSPDYMVLKFLIQPIVPLFYHYALRSPAMIANYRRVAYGVRPGQWRLMYPDFARLRLPLPSVEQQQATVDRINSNTEAIESAISRIRREISLLREYQTRLISDVVTGKLDVRELARSLPEDISEEAAELAATESADEDFATADELIEEAV